jgi:hypothetical protein
MALEHPTEVLASGNLRRDLYFDLLDAFLQL